MADTSCQRECEAWVRDVWLRQHFGESFFERRVQLSTGGEFEFDAVSEDGQIVVSISTSKALMSSGKRGVGKLMKIRSDMMFHMLAGASRNYMVFTEACMYESLLAEKDRGRTPSDLEFLLVDLPEALSMRLAASRRRSSREVSPNKDVLPVDPH